MRAVELLLPAGALVAAVAVLAAVLRGRRARRAPALPREVERLLEAVPGALGDAVLVLEGARIVRVNAAAVRLAARAPAELVGRELAVLGADLPVLAKGLARGPATAVVSVATPRGPLRVRAALLRVAHGLDAAVLRPEPPPSRPPPLPGRAATPPLPPEPPPHLESALAAAATAVRDPLGRAARATSLLRLCAPPLGARADAALAAIEMALADAERRLGTLAAMARPGARRTLDLAALVEDVLRAFAAPSGLRVRADVAPARAHGDDRPLRSALREVLRELTAALPAGEEVEVAVRGGEPPPSETGSRAAFHGGDAYDPVIELAVEAAAPPGIAAIARALLAPHGARVTEDAAPGHGWRLRIALPCAPDVAAAASGAHTFV